jgi:hypothetical protein
VERRGFQEKEFKPRMNANERESLFILMIHLFPSLVVIREYSCSFAAKILSILGLGFPRIGRSAVGFKRHSQ